MSGSKQPTFLVSAYSEPIVIRIHGKANYLNCKNFREFMEKMVGDRKHRFALDFEHCTGMDSTFLGILAGTALELRRQDPPGVLLICNLNERNRELICNLGLQSLLSIDAEVSAPEEAVVGTVLDDAEVSSARQVLAAHQSLVEANQKNAATFQDVIAFLQNQLGPDN
jgi:anti-anti-sigma factor